MSLKPLVRHPVAGGKFVVEIPDCPNAVEGSLYQSWVEVEDTPRMVGESRSKIEAESLALRGFRRPLSG